MRLLFIFIILVTSLFSLNTDNRIKKKSSDIKYQKIATSNMNLKLDSFIKSMNRQKLILNNIEAEKRELNKQIKLLSTELSLKSNNVLTLKKEREKLKQEKDKNQKAILDYFSHNYYLSQTKTVSTEDLINEEIVKQVSKISKKKIAKLSNKYMNLNNRVSYVEKKINKLKHKQLSLREKKRELTILEKSHKQEVKKLNAKIRNYKIILEKMLRKKRTFQRELAKLKLIKEKEIQKARLEARKKRLAEEKKRALAEKRRKLADRKANLSNSQNRRVKNVKVKKYGSSYIKSKTRKYRGARTISPISNAKVLSRFGNYRDPVYKIEIYNDSIILKGRKNAKVRAIFDGKVVYVGKSSNKNMVVIKHNNRLYSIYANISQISPFIKKGYRIKKGDIIARVEDELTFEITYNDMAINPLDVIRLK